MNNIILLKKQKYLNFNKYDQQKYDYAETKTDDIDIEELKNDLIFNNKKSLNQQISKLESANFDELMIAYRRPEDLEYILKTVKDCT